MSNTITPIHIALMEKAIEKYGNSIRLMEEKTLNGSFQVYKKFGLTFWFDTPDQSSKMVSELELA